MVEIKETIEFIFITILFVNALLFIPQSIRIIKKRTSKGLSLITFSGLFFIQFVIFLFGIFIHNFLLTLGYFVNMMAVGSIVLLMLIYKKRKSSGINDLDLEEVLAQLPGHIYWKDKDGVVVGSNTNNWQDFGSKSLKDFLGKTDYDIFSKEEADQLKIVDTEVMRTGLAKIIEEPLTNTDGKKIYYLSHKMPLKNKKGHTIGILGVSIDVTVAKQETIDKLEMLENIIAVMPGTVYWMNRDGVYLGCNDNEAKAIGLSSRKDIIGKRNIDLPGFLIPEALDPINEKVMKTGKLITLEEPAVLQDGTKATFISSKVPLKNSRNEVIGLVGISVDITEQKKLEKELAEAKIREAHLKALSSIGGMIAHELRTPLASIGLATKSIQKFLPTLIKGYEEYAKRSGTQEIRDEYIHSLKTTAEDIEQAARYASNTIKTILTGFHYVTSGSASLEEVDVNATVQKALLDYPLSQEERDLITFESQKEYKALASTDVIIHVLHNLLKNALYAIQAANKGTISISIEKVKNHIHLIFKDTAKGIPEEIRKHIFEPFYTTKDSATSIGLGLYFCKMALEKINASISCDSEVDEYTIFTIKFKGLPNH